MRLVVTGATGFLGWRAATLLAEAGHDVLAVAKPRGANAPTPATWSQPSSMPAPPLRAI